MRRRAKVDDNHAAIVAAFRAAGCSVQSLAPIGRGCPDLLIGKHGVTTVVEVKRDEKAVLTEDESDWHHAWGGSYHIVITIDDALEVVGWIKMKSTMFC